MYCIGLLTVPAAYAALFCIAWVTAGVGLQLPFTTSPAMYAVAALTALVSPLFIPMLFLLVPVCYLLLSCTALTNFGATRWNSGVAHIPDCCAYTLLYSLSTAPK